MLDPDPGGRLEPTDARHPQVHQHDVRPVLGDTRQRLLAVGGLADDVDAVEVLQDGDHAGAEHRVVVGDQHADAHR